MYGMGSPLKTMFIYGPMSLLPTICFRDPNTNLKFNRFQLRKGASVGANSTVLAGVTVGEYALIGAGSVVTKNDPG